MIRIFGRWALLVLVIFSGCKKETTYERYIDNRTDDTLTFHFAAADAALFGADSLIVLPKKLDRIYQQIDPEMVEYDTCEPFSNGTTLETSSGRSLTKSLTSTDSWTLIYNRPGNMYQCFFQIREIELQ